MGKVKQEIAAFLKKNHFCVLCTCSKDASRATPVRYWCDDLKIIIYSEKYTSKFKFLKKNSKVSVALYNSRAPIKGLQLWGSAEIVTRGDPRHETYLPPQVKKNPKMQAAREILDLIQIIPHKIVMLDQSRKGRPYLVWELDKRGQEKEQEIKTLRDLYK